MADWGHELGVRLRQGEQARGVRKRDDVYRLDLSTDEGDVPVLLAQSSDTGHGPGVYEPWSCCLKPRAAHIALHGLPTPTPHPRPCPPITAGASLARRPVGVDEAAGLSVAGLTSHRAVLC